MARRNSEGNVNNKFNNKPKSAKFNSANVDKAKVAKILKELDELDDIEELNKSIEAEQARTRAKDHNAYSSPHEKIQQKNEEFLDKVYDQQQKTKRITAQRNENLNVIITIVLFLLLVATLTGGVYLFLKRITAYDETYIRVSVSMTNKDIFYETKVNGEPIPKSVSPGDKFKLNIIAKNSNAITGDSTGEEWTNIFVRFKILLKINGVEHPEFIYVEPNPENWERYNKEIEDGYTMTDSSGNGVPVVQRDDGYYYCRKILKPNEEITVIDWLRFSEDNITELVGGSDAVLEVVIEALDASIPQIITDRTMWSDAPQHWVEAMMDPSLYEDDAVALQPEEPVSMVWIGILVVIAVALTIVLALFTTRRRTSKTNIDDLGRRANRK